MFLRRKIKVKCILYTSNKKHPPVCIYMPCKTLHVNHPWAVNIFIIKTNKNCSTHLNKAFKDISKIVPIKLQITQSPPPVLAWIYICLGICLIIIRLNIFLLSNFLGYMIMLFCACPSQSAIFSSERQSCRGLDWTHLAGNKREYSGLSFNTSTSSKIVRYFEEEKNTYKKKKKKKKKTHTKKIPFPFPQKVYFSNCNSFRQITYM